jgi:hypothetical protein
VAGSPVMMLAIQGLEEKAEKSGHKVSSRCWLTGMHCAYYALAMVLAGWPWRRAGRR